MTNEFENIYVRAMLEKTNGNLTKAAELAGVSRRFLQRTIVRLGLREPHDTDDADRDGDARVWRQDRRARFGAVGPGVAHGDRRGRHLVLEGERALTCGGREPFDLGRDLGDPASGGVLHDRHEQAALGVHGESDVHGIAELDHVLEPIRVQQRVVADDRA